MRRWGDLILEEPLLCSRCAEEFKPRLRKSKFAGHTLYWLYEYNEAFRSTLYTLKGCGDYELKDVFLSRQAPLLKLRFRGYEIVPAPSYHERDEVRGFNHVEAIFASLGLPIRPYLRKTADKKQADSSKEERKQIGKFIAITEGAKIKGKKILFVDDVLTTGSTLKACVSLLASKGAKRVETLVLARVRPV